MIEFELHKSIYVPINIDRKRGQWEQNIFTCVRKYINTPDFIFIQ